ncbi:MAG: hypothetical protein FJ295_19665 [Planctomycetes bacterium]|nr:hypothetical protein [Planctomycetota bacterium]
MANIRTIADGSFNITRACRTICSAIGQQVPELAHLDVPRIGFSVSQTRSRTRYGIYASLTPLRFKHGAATQWRRDAEVTIQQVRDEHGRELLYLLSLYLPRFMDISFDEKLITIFHELWHISPRFNGDIRRHEGRCFAHTGSKAAYDRGMKLLADRWLAITPDRHCTDFLRLNFRELQATHGTVVGTRYLRPKLIPVRGQQGCSQRGSG